ncbi:MAG TPA: quinone-interacting membrane-bound oxidoreductase complex subunit QmoC [Syntrophobacteria bacterium]|nr:quinone-interacting membrane-bound oxidoreductase complex subunit QmoC [Syntrophobacteria bacterium]
MAERSAVSKAATPVEPDLEFVREIQKAGGDTLKKCFQCATCSVVCPLSPDQKPYPRKEMSYAQWGLKDRLVNDVDVWLCHYCNDCSTYCPRGARPGDALRAVRAASFKHFALFGFMGKIVGEAKYFPVMLGIPVVLLLMILGFTGHLNIPAGEVDFRKLFPLIVVDIIFVTMATLAVVSLGFGIKSFLLGIHDNGIREGYAEDLPLDWKKYAQSLVTVIPTILFHKKFQECTTNKDRYTAHLLVFFGFIGLFIVTSLGFLGLYIVPVKSLADFLAPPYTIGNPVKWLAAVSALSLLVGILLVINNRMKKKAVESRITYLDWSLILAILVVVVTGISAWLLRLAGVAGLAYPVYFVHLVGVFYIIAYLPYSKLAHLVYRTAAMGYAAYVGRPFGVRPAPMAVPAVAEKKD